MATITGIAIAIATVTMTESERFDSELSPAELSKNYQQIAKESDPLKRIEAINVLYTASNRHHPHIVQDYLKVALDLARSIEFRQGIALTLSNLGWSYLDTDNYERARAALLESLELWREQAHGDGILRCLNGLGACYMDMGIFERAIVHFRDALRQAESAGQLWHYGIILINLAKCFIDLEQYEQALHCLNQVVENDSISPLNRAIRLHRMGIACRHLGNLDAAKTHLETAIQYSTHHTSLLLQCETELALLLLAQKKYQAAEDKIQKCLPQIDALSDRRILCEALLCLGNILEAAKKTTEAEKHFIHALMLSRDLSAGVLEVRACRALSILFRNQHNFEKALEYAEKCRDQERRMARESNSLLAFSMEEERKMREAQLFREQHEHMLAVGELGRLLTGSLQLDQILETVYQKLQRLIPADVFTVGLYDANHTALVMQLRIEHGKRMPELRIPLNGGGLAAWSFSNSQPIMINDISETKFSEMPAIPLNQERENPAFIYMPLLRGERTIGLVHVQSKEPHVYNKHHVNTLSALALYLAIAMENAALFARLQVLATEDSLTGFSNRRRLHEVAEEEFRRSERYNSPFCVLIMDLDHFKDINDLYGHDAGDLVLRLTGELIRGMMRDIDGAFRYGGEEFVFILPNTDLAGGCLLAERIREAQYTVDFVFTSNPLETIHVSASIGVAQRMPSDKDFDAMLFRADKALYQAKSDGRNRVAFSN